MIIWLFKHIILSLVLIISIHYTYVFLKDNLTTPKTIDLIQKPKEKFYTGKYPKWSEEYPIHIIGHSMGGQTARMLDYLLKQEFYIDQKTRLKEGSDLLGSSKTGYIKSITALSTPHNGTTLAEIVTKTIPFIQYFVGIAGVVGTNFYNFDLEQKLNYNF